MSGCGGCAAALPDEPTAEGWWIWPVVRSLRWLAQTSAGPRMVGARRGRTFVFCGTCSGLLSTGRYVALARRVPTAAGCTPPLGPAFLKALHGVLGEPYVPCAGTGAPADLVREGVDAA